MQMALDDWPKVRAACSRERFPAVTFISNMEGSLQDSKDGASLLRIVVARFQRSRLVAAVHQSSLLR
jgi:hypothetical protein